MINRSASDPLNRLSLYPNPQSSRENSVSLSVRRSSTRTEESVSPTSCPYAPTFWTGVPPVEPGIPERHSIPAHPFPAARSTTLSHGSPAPTVRTASSRDSSARKPRKATFSTTPSNPSSANMILLPPENTCTGSPSSCANRRVARRSSPLVQRANHRAGPPSPIVVYGASTTFAVKQGGGEGIVRASSGVAV